MATALLRSTPTSSPRDLRTRARITVLLVSTLMFMVFGGGQVWVADSGAPYHMPDDPIFMFECKSLSVSKGALLVGDMKSIEVEWFGKLNMVTHSAGRDLGVVLMNVSRVPGLKFHLCSLLVITPKCSATMSSAGLHVMGSRLTFARGVSGSYVKVTRMKPDTFIAAPILSPGKMQRWTLTISTLPLPTLTR